MHRIIPAIWGLVVIVQLSQQATVPADLYYNAGVVEFRPSALQSLEDRVNDNLLGYLQIIDSEEALDLDIIVFPESTLNNNDHQTFVPNPLLERVVPCDAQAGKYHNILVQLSCAARASAKYVVINLTEKEWCSSVPEDDRPCASSGLNTFNTNVVFDREGAVVSRYRKVHLYGEKKNSTFVPEFGWFDTDFGVRFGHFICFDILFYSPAQEMVDVYGIKDFIFTTMWFSQLPFLTAVQVHQAWSYGNDVNLLAAGSSNPTVGSTGSGIYNGRKGILVAHMKQGTGERALYVAQVPKHQSRHRLEKRSMPSAPQRILTKPDIFLKRDYLEFYETVLLDLGHSSSLSQGLCYAHTSFCCSFELKWRPVPLGETNPHYFYRLGVFDGLRSEDAAETNALKNCALFSCSGPDIADCGKLMDIATDVVFENITITGNFPTTEGFLIMPNSLKVADLMPVPVGDFEWSEDDIGNQQIRVRYRLKATVSNLMAFSIYGNYYDGDAVTQPCCTGGDGDGGGGGGGGAAAMAVSIWCVIMLILVQPLLKLDLL